MSLSITKAVPPLQVVQSGGKNIELAVMQKGETLKVKSSVKCRNFLTPLFIFPTRVEALN